MTREEFYAICEKTTGVYGVVPNLKNKFNHYVRSKEKELNEAFIEQGVKAGQELIYIEWKSGGEQGGSCWDNGKDDRHYQIDPDPKPNFDSLDLVIETVCPTISFMMYKRVVRDLIKTFSYREYEYYGNYTVYSVEYVVLDDLYKRMENVLNGVTPDNRPAGKRKNVSGKKAS